MGITSLQLHTGNTHLLVGCEGPTTYDLSLTRVFEREGEPGRKGMQHPMDRDRSAAASHP